jgi:hypothetical protein
MMIIFKEHTRSGYILLFRISFSIAHPQTGIKIALLNRIFVKDIRDLIAYFTTAAPNVVRRRTINDPYRDYTKTLYN